MPAPHWFAEMLKSISPRCWITLMYTALLAAFRRFIESPRDKKRLAEYGAEPRHV